jgi:hypothetical protein
MGDGKTALGSALLLFVLYNLNGHATAVSDAYPNVYLAANVVENGSLAFASSRRPARLLDPGLPGLIPSSRVDASTGEALYVSFYGPGAALAAAPVLGALRPFAGALLGLDGGSLLLLGKIAASLYAAASAALLYLTARRWVARRIALLLAFAFALGTPMWTGASQTLWQHGPTSFFLLLGIALFVRGGLPGAAGAGASFAAAVACRPLAFVFGAAVGVHLLVVNRRAAVAFALGALPVAAALAAYNLYWLGSPFRSGQAALMDGSLDVWGTPLLEGLAGILVSPSRGLLVFSPFLAAAAPGAVLAWRRPQYRELRPLSIAVLLGLLIHAKWFMWWGGHSYSYRILVDLSGALALLTIPSLDWILERRARLAVFSGLVVWAVLVHALGVAVSGGTWSGHPNVDDPRHRHRLWALKTSAIPYELWEVAGWVRAQL